MISHPFSAKYQLAKQGVLDDLIGAGGINLPAVNGSIGVVDRVIAVPAFFQPQH